MQSPSEALSCLLQSWPFIVCETRQVLGSELHYQAMIYHCLRQYGNVPIGQLGTNVKMRIMSPQSKLFKELDNKKHVSFRGGFEPIPDVCIFSSRVNADWRRRNRETTLASLLLAIEIKASERENSRLQSSEIQFDIQKLAAHRFESNKRGFDFYPVMMILDTAPSVKDRMKPNAIESMQAIAADLNVGILYLSPEHSIELLSNAQRT